MITGAIILVVGALAGWMGRVSVERLQRRAALPPPPVCQCTHDWSAHNTAGQCVAEIDEPVYKDGYFSHYKGAPCACVRYCGPVPLEAYGFQQLQPPPRD